MPDAKALYRARNREKLRAASREYRKQNPHIAQREMSRRYTDITRSIKHKLSSARSRARKNGIPFDITVEDIYVPTHCPILGIKLETHPKSAHRGSSPSIDRVDNKKGYVRGNVAIISDRANMRKGNLDIGEVRNLLAYMEMHALLS